VNVREKANPSGKVLTQVNPGDTFIAEDKLVTNPSDGSKWYKIIIVGNEYTPLAEDKRFGVAAAYIRAGFTHAMKLHKDEDAKIAGILANAKTASEGGAEAGKVRTIKVSNAHQFLEALGSDRIIEMAPGKYNLSEWDPILNNQPEQTPPYPNLKNGVGPKLSKGVSWSDDPFDGGEIVLGGVKNLTIRGWGQDSPSTIIIDPRYSFVLKFVKCSDIVIESLTAGHSEGGFCMGGVFSFEDSSRITINSSNMFGCGTWGLELSNVSVMNVTNSRIYECTEGIMVISGGKNIAFDNCEFIENVGVVSVGETTVAISNSIFRDNKNESDYPIERSENVKFEKCTFD
jgi:hypothetical protein